MSDDKTGGQAFPIVASVTPHWNDGNYSNEPDRYTTDTLGGMTLRDYFAAQALAGMLAAVVGDFDERVAAKSAYTLADAMLAARKAGDK